jgi:hypothetical protein
MINCILQLTDKGYKRYPLVSSSDLATQEEKCLERYHFYRNGDEGDYDDNHLYEILTDDPYWGRELDFSEERGQ